MSKTRQQTHSECTSVNEDLITKICKQQSEMIGRQIDEKLSNFENSVKNIISDVKANTERVVQLEKKIALLEQHIKQRNIVVYGMQETENESIEEIEDKMILMCKNKLNINIESSDFEKT